MFLVKRNFFSGKVTFLLGEVREVPQGDCLPGTEQGVPDPAAKGCMPGRGGKGSWVWQPSVCGLGLSTGDSGLWVFPHKLQSCLGLSPLGGFFFTCFWSVLSRVWVLCLPNLAFTFEL